MSTEGTLNSEEGTYRVPFSKPKEIKWVGSALKDGRVIRIGLHLWRVQDAIYDVKQDEVVFDVEEEHGVVPAF
jgi:hypothetical protein